MIAAGKKKMKMKRAGNFACSDNHVNDLALYRYNLNKTYNLSFSILQLKYSI